jgi:elongation factor P
MVMASDIRVGNVIRVDGKLCKVLTQEIRGTGKFGKSAMLKLRSLDEGNVIEKKMSADADAEEVDTRVVEMQYLYREGDHFMFMNMETYDQFPLSEKAVGKHEVFLRENEVIKVLFGEGKVLSIAFPKIVELKVASTAKGVGGGANFKDAELENGLKVLVPQFVSEGETIRLNTDDLSYLDRVSVKSMS